MDVLKKLFLKELSSIVGDNTIVAIALSSGIDSSCIMFGLLELGIKVKAYTFRVSNTKSQDYIYAKKNAEIFGIDFIDCPIPVEINKEILRKIILDRGKIKKTDIECIYPFYYLFPQAKERTIVTGSCSDGHFCISKKGMIHYRGSLEKIQEFRNILFNNIDYAQTSTLDYIAEEEFGINIDTPFNKKSIRDYFYNKTWGEINKPHQKQSLINMFPEQFKKIKIFNHTNLQCGDSGIREIFEPLLEGSIINPKGRKRMIDLYRDIAERGRI